MNKLQERTALKRIGETAYNNLNEKMTIVEYNDSDNVVVQFENGLLNNVQYGNFKRGSVKGVKVRKRKLLDRVGEVSSSNFNGEEMTIIEYINSSNAVIQFKSGYVTTKSYKAFIDGEIRNPYHKSIYGVGYLGEGIHKVRENGSTKVSKCYKTFSHMIERCYNMDSYDKQHTYANCTVVEEWHNFQNFADWYDKNFYQIPNKLMCLDKDILVKGNKIYSPETCCFVPKSINNLFTKDDARRGDFAIGVTEGKHVNKYKAQYNVNGEITYLGSHFTPEEAFLTYKTNKEKLIKDIADEHNDRIPLKLYDAMYRYEVDITD